MRILFMGTPEFALPSLSRLYADGHEIAGVICQPDKPRGRGMKLVPPPVKVWALQKNIPVHQPETLKNGAILPLLEKTKPDLIIVVAYGKLLPAYVLRHPPFGCVNLHGSLLPAYRGAAPIQRAVIDGCPKTGVTTMHMAEALDAGDMILQYETVLGEYETAGELHDRLMEAGAALLGETVRRIEKGEAPRTPQDESLATYAPMLKKEEGRIDWTADSGKIVNLVRGMNPWPTAFTTLHGETIKLHRAVKAESPAEKNAPPGTVVGFNKNAGLLIACGSGFLSVTELQAAGGRKMSAEEYARGHAGMIGSRFV